jgi:hypothetical protein
VRERFKTLGAAKLSLQMAQNRQKRANSDKLKVALSDGWQGDLGWF